MTGCLPVGTDRDAGSTVCEVSGGWWVVARTVRWIVVEWVDRGGREKERGNGRGRTAGGWAAGRGAGTGPPRGRTDAGAEIGRAGCGRTGGRDAAGCMQAARVAQVEWEEQGSAVCKTACLLSR